MTQATSQQASESDLQASIIEDTPIKGLARRVTELAAVQDEQIGIEALRTHAISEGIPVTAGRGLPVFQSLWRRLRARNRTIVDLGQHRGEFRWFALHVPPKGEASFKLESETETRRDFSLKLLGFGLGDGRKVTLSLSREFPKLNTCVQFVQVADVHLTQVELDWSDGTRETELTTDVVSLGPQKMKPWQDCPFCGVSTSDVDPYRYEVATPYGVDLREAAFEEVRTQKLKINTEHKADISWPVKVPVFPDAFNAGVTVSTSASLLCEATWHFPAHSVFVPYFALGHENDLPYWSVEQ